MKKLFALALAAMTMLLTGCSDFFIDATAVHNGLVDKMDAVLSAEEAFYDEYFNIQEGDSATTLVNYYDNFKFAAEELDKYFTETKFASSQQIFIDQYNEYYKPMVDKYLSGAGNFVSMVEENGFVLADAEQYFEEMDAYGQEFVDTHNRLIDTINLQADY